MNGQAFGGGILLAVGAALWAVYFLPIWTKRRQFSAAQGNALRIQRTLRMLAETSDVPDEVHVEATAKQVLAHERLLQATERSQKAEQRAKIAEIRLAEKQAILEARAAKRQAQAVKRELIRRSRSIKALRTIAVILGTLSLLGLIVGVVLMVLGFGLTTLGVSGATLLISLMSLVAMAPRRTPTAPVAQATPSLQPAVMTAAPAQKAAQHVNARGRIPQAAALRTTNVAPTASEQPLGVTSEEELAHAKTLLEIARRKAEAFQRDEARRSEHPASADAGTARAAYPTEPRQAQRVAQRAPLRPGAPQAQDGLVTSQRGHATQSDLSPSVSLTSMDLIDNLSAELPNLDEALLRRRSAS